MAKQSAGILLFRRTEGSLELLLAHPGGPFWARKDEGAWSLPKGEFSTEDPLEAARREFAEETGRMLDGPFLPLGQVRQRSGKTVWAWACEGDFDPAALRSNTCEVEWPPGSGRRIVVPEIDRVAWFDPVTARSRILAAQRPFLDRIEETLQA